LVDIIYFKQYNCDQLVIKKQKGEVVNNLLISNTYYETDYITGLTIQDKKYSYIGKGERERTIPELFCRIVLGVLATIFTAGYAYKNYPPVKELFSGKQILYIYELVIKNSDNEGLGENLQEIKEDEGFEVVVGDNDENINIEQKNACINFKNNLYLEANKELVDHPLKDRIINYIKSHHLTFYFKNNTSTEIERVETVMSNLYSSDKDNISIYLATKDFLNKRNLVLFYDK
jgi:hypothetical protein